VDTERPLPTPNANEDTARALDTDNGRASTEQPSPSPNTDEHAARTTDNDDHLHMPQANQSPLDVSNARPSLFGTWRTSGSGIYEQTDGENNMEGSVIPPIQTPLGQNDDMAITTLPSLNDDSTIPAPLCLNNDTPLPTTTGQSRLTPKPNLIIDPALLHVTAIVTDIRRNNTVEEGGDDDPVVSKLNEGRNKRKRLQTADDLAAAEASKYGASTNQRRQPRPRMIARRQ